MLRKKTNLGYLKNREIYLVNRIAFYGDRFKQNKSLSDSRCVGGCYIMPLGLSSEARRYVATARVLTIIPDGQTRSDALDLVLDDVVNCAVNGVQGMDPYERRVRFFIDPVAFFGDYPAVAATADVMGHKADVFCML
eukprot:gb/GEZJ01005776.1/.p1 GENE.gb/GEZJ01005776.1/~~gb/GEZJ01005776.1/.p1  ORF type:complete len:137 (-),score=9.29 gb/GEZJ01005776.1/:984-1394(-)